MDHSLSLPVSSLIWIKGTCSSTTSWARSRASEARGRTQRAAWAPCPHRLRGRLLSGARTSSRTRSASKYLALAYHYLFCSGLSRPASFVAARQPVKRIIVQNEAAKGIELQDGTKIEAKVVMSNATPKVTFLDLVGKVCFKLFQVVFIENQTQTQSMSRFLSFKLGQSSGAICAIGGGNQLPGRDHQDQRCGCRLFLYYWALISSYAATH